MKSIRVCGLFLAALTCAVLLLVQSRMKHVDRVTATTTVVSLGAR